MAATATAAPAASPWGAPTTPRAPAASLSDIMAAQEQEEVAPPAAPAPWACGVCTFEQAGAGPACEMCGAPRPEDEGFVLVEEPAAAPEEEGPAPPEEAKLSDDEALARRLAAEETEDQPDQDGEGDLAFALRLQREELALSQREQQSTKLRVVNPLERELLSADDYHVEYDEDAEAEQEGEAEALAQAAVDAEEGLGAWNSNAGQFTGLGVRSHRVRAALYRDAETGELVSKHDAALAGRHNARQLERHCLMPDDVLISNRVANQVRRSVARANNKGVSSRGRVERRQFATAGGVLDQRTRALLTKLVNAEVVEEIHGQLSAGKEANVYHAVAPDGSGLALKLFRTTLDQFSNRVDYVQGDHRYYGAGFARSSTRQKVGAWAEKEANNLRRLANAGVRVPAFVARREHVLVMSFVGDADGTPAPKLREVQLSRRGWATAYAQVTEALRAMYQRARLVHGDFSEYNVLYHQRQVVVIDVGQAVEYQHPRADEFLLRDCTVITNFFRNKELRGALLEPEELMAQVKMAPAQSELEAVAEA